MGGMDAVLLNTLIVAYEAESCANMYAIQLCGHQSLGESPSCSECYTKHPSAGRHLCTCRWEEEIVADTA